MSFKLTCTHNTCKDLFSKNVDGVAILPIINYYRTGLYVCLLGKENSGSYAKQYNIFSGGVEVKDGCYLKTLMRELREESKIEVTWSDFDKKFRKEGKITYFVKPYKNGGTAVFVGRFDGTSRDELNKKVILENNSPQLPYCYKEMDSVEFFNLKTCEAHAPKVFKGEKVSTFAVSVMKEVFSNLNLYK